MTNLIVENLINNSVGFFSGLMQGLDIFEHD